MATKVTVNGKQYARPDIYSTIKSGITNPPINLSYGNALLIDTGIGAGFGGGSGIIGDNKSGINSVYEFNNMNDLRNFVKGGELWNLAEPLFIPETGVNGVSKLFFVKAATTTKATKILTFTNGSLTFATKDEGIVANGILTSSELTKGYAIKLIASPKTAGKYIMQFWMGTFKGLDALNSNAPYNNILQADSKPVKVYETEEVSTLAELVAIFNKDKSFNDAFTLTASTITSTGAIVVGDLTSISGYQLFASGSETYATDLTATLEIVKNLDFTHILCAEYDTNAESANNTTIFQYLTSGTLKYEKYGWVGAGYDSGDFVDSQGTTEYYDSPKINVVHGGGLQPDRTKVNGYRNVSSLYVTAAVMGRTLGLEPQTPITFKSIKLGGLKHILSDDEKETAISKGLIYLNYDFELGKIVVGSGTNSMQTNDYLIDSEGNSYSISIERIKSQLNKELIFNAKRKFFGGETGANRNTVSAVELKTWVQSYLTSKLATSTDDNLIVDFDPSDITIVRNQDIYNVTYSFVPNGEVTKIVFTGFMLD